MIYFFRRSYCWLLKLISNCLTNLGFKWGCDLVNVGIRCVCVCSMNGVRRFVFSKITYVCLCGCYCTSWCMSTHAGLLHAFVCLSVFCWRMLCFCALQQWYTATMNLLATWLTERMDQQLHVYQLKILIRIVKVFLSNLHGSVYALKLESYDSNHIVLFKISICDSGLA